MKVKWIKLCQWLLGILGISATISSCLRAEYGQPYMTYLLKGKVVDAETGEGIKGIEVLYGSSFSREKDTTEVDGRFELSGENWPEDVADVRLRDIDPESDGSYKSTSESVPLQQVQGKSGTWYFGEYKAEDVVLKMEKDGKE